MVKCLIMFFLLPGIQSQTNATQKNASALGICLIMVCRFFWDTVQTNPVFTLYLFDKKEPKSNAKQFVPCQFGSIWSPLHLIDIPGGNRGRDQQAKLQGSDSESYDWHHHNLGQKTVLSHFFVGPFLLCTYILSTILSSKPCLTDLAERICWHSGGFRLLGPKVLGLKLAPSIGSSSVLSESHRLQFRSMI